MIAPFLLIPSILMGASIRQGAFITEGLLKKKEKFNSIEGPFIRQEVFIWKWALPFIWSFTLYACTDLV